ncbi:MAG: hypothetical protein IPK19_15640 [Chloroflexi bacterium]|nr:hypothetical protein [Chloroflexota bacterium]
MVGFIVRAIFVGTLVLTFFDAAGTLIRDRAAAYLFGEIALDEYLYENTGAYANAMVSLPAGSQVRLMYEPRSLYCRRRFAARRMCCSTTGCGRGSPGGSGRRRCSSRTRRRETTICWCSMRCTIRC